MKRSYFVLIFFSIAMAFLESAVVIDLRALVFPDGFDFPIRPMNKNLGIVELWREFATIVMLIGIAWQSGKTPLHRLAYFFIAFAVWDIFYYVFLYVFLSWPSSLFTWDLLFLLPVPWVGPVLAPVLVSVYLWFFGTLILIMDSGPKNHGINYKEYIPMLLGCAIILFSFTSDFLSFLGDGPGKSLAQMAYTYVPVNYSWGLFSIGSLWIMIGIFLYWRRLRNHASLLI